MSHATTSHQSFPLKEKAYALPTEILILEIPA